MMMNVMFLYILARPTTFAYYRWSESCLFIWQTCMITLRICKFGKYSNEVSHLATEIFLTKLILTHILALHKVSQYAGAQKHGVPQAILIMK